MLTERKPRAEMPEGTRGSQHEDLAAMEKKLEDLKAINNGAVACDQCGKLCKSAFGLDVHKARAHNEERTPAVCPHCKRTFSSALGLRTHLLRKHEGRNWSNRATTAASAAKRRAMRRSKPTSNGNEPPPLTPLNNEHPILKIPNFCPMCGYGGLRAIFLAMNFRKEGE